MNRRIPTLQRRMRLIKPGLLRQFLAKRAPFSDRVTVHQIPRLVALMGPLAQTPQSPPFGRDRPNTGADNQRSRRTAAERNPVLGLPGGQGPLYALRHNADAKNSQTGADHAAP